MEESDTPRTAVLVPSEELKRLQRERDEARAEVERLRGELFSAQRGRRCVPRSAEKEES